MSFLRYENGKIEIEDDAMTIPEIKKLYAHDKVFFGEAIIYLYWMYKRGGIYKQKLPRQRQEIIKQNYLSRYTPEEIEKNIFFKNLKKYYIEDQHTTAEIFYENLKRDMQDLLDHISSIPFKKKAILTSNVEVDLPGGKKHTIFAQTEVEMDNSEEKAKAIGLADKLLIMDEKLASRIKNDESEKRIADSRTLFDIAE